MKVEAGYAVHGHGRVRTLKFDCIVVGAGFSGSVVAERLASRFGQTVLVVERRNHIAGNAYDEYDDHGILVHRYGPHIFHTNSEKVFRYLSGFTEWICYEHRVLSYVDGQLVPIPINLDTINQLYGKALDEEGVRQFYADRRVATDRIRNSRDVIVSQVGVDLYNKFFKGYTQKQWGVTPEYLDPSVCGRIPMRTNRDPRYFTDRFQVIPKHGYTKMFQRMLSHPKIKLLLQTDFREVVDIVSFDHLFFTGPIDEYFEFKHGQLPYRSLQFEFRFEPVEYKQPVATINFPNDYDFTRITEIKRITRQKHSGTTLIYEYPTADGDPYYPMPTVESRSIYKLYQEEASSLKKVSFLGRLGSYKYYNMDQVVAQALEIVDGYDMTSLLTN